MTTFNPSDRIRIVWPYSDSHGLTATIVCPRVLCGVDGYTIGLDTPPAGMPSERWIPAHRIELVEGGEPR